MSRLLKSTGLSAKSYELEASSSIPKPKSTHAGGRLQMQCHNIFIVKVTVT